MDSRHLATTQQQLELQKKNVTQYLTAASMVYSILTQEMLYQRVPAAPVDKEGGSCSFTFTYHHPFPGRILD